MKSPEELIDGCRNFKREAQEALYRKFAAKLFGVCISYSPNREMASDILHDSFVKIFTRFRDFDSRNNLEDWIRKVVVQTSVDHLRKTNSLRFAEIDQPAMEVEAAKTAPVQGAEKDLGWIVDKLPPGARTIFNLYTLEGYNHTEIADMLQISEQTSESQFSRARKIIQVLVGKYYSGK